MTRPLFWRLCLFASVGIVALFYLISIFNSRTEDRMSHLAPEHRAELLAWGEMAAELYAAGDSRELNHWLQSLMQRESTWAAVARYQVVTLAGADVQSRYQGGHNMGRSVDWKVHLYFEHNPTMELLLPGQDASLLVQLPERMRPGAYWQLTDVAIQILLPAVLLGLVAFGFYRYLMRPLAQLHSATRQVSQGNFSVRAGQLMGQRGDEFAALADAFDQMAIRIEEQIVSQRQLIADLSHELRTPLARLDVAVDALRAGQMPAENRERIARESRHIRRLVEDALSLAWLENERPSLRAESLDLVELVDALVDDARFEFPDRELQLNAPGQAILKDSSHRAAGQALENILRNALRHTPVGKRVLLTLSQAADRYCVVIRDQGPGVPPEALEAIFKPFFQLDGARSGQQRGFGLGLALARRLLAAIGGSVEAVNHPDGGLEMRVELPLSQT